MGRGGVRGGPPPRRARARLGRLLDLPLVPRHGARDVLGSGARLASERGVRRDQGRPRGAPGGRCGPHHRGRRLHGSARLAAQRLHDARGPHLPRGHLLAARAARRAPVVPPGARRRRRRLDHPARPGRAGYGAAERRDPGGLRARIRRVAAPRRRRARPGRRRARLVRGRGAQRVRIRAQVPRRARRAAARHARDLGGARARARDVDRRAGAPHARRDGRVRPARPGGGRLLPLLHAPRLVRAALRADALRQRPAPRRLRARRGRGGRGGDRRVPHGDPEAGVGRVRVGAGLGEHGRRAPRRGRVLRAGCGRSRGGGTARGRRQGAHRLERARDRRARPGGPRVRTGRMDRGSPRRRRHAAPGARAVGRIPRARLDRRPRLARGRDARGPRDARRRAPRAGARDGRGRVRDAGAGDRRRADRRGGRRPAAGRRGLPRPDGRGSGARGLRPRPRVRSRRASPRRRRPRACSGG